MAEDSGQEKTEEPTPKKVDDAKKKGQIARSKELGTMFVLIFSAISLLMYGPEIGKGLYRIMGRMLSLNRNETYDTTKCLPYGERWPTYCYFLCRCLYSLLYWLHLSVIPCLAALILVGKQLRPKPVKCRQ